MRGPAQLAESLDKNRSRSARVAIRHVSKTGETSASFPTDRGCRGRPTARLPSKVGKWLSEGWKTLWLILLATGCEKAPPPPEHAPSIAPSTSQVTAPRPAPPPATPPSASAESTDQSQLGTACGELDCRSFDSEVLAFAYVLRQKPRVLGVGEAHAQKGTEHVASATKRFAQQLLPTLERKASDLVIELLIADGSCKKPQQAVAQKQKPITEPQATTNQNEFVLLGNQAKRLGMTPHALKPTCEQYDRLAKAGATDISQMLELVASETERTVKGLLERRPDSIIVTYGGALHNDIVPRAGRENWSFGPALNTHTAGHYLELDLIVPEYVKDTETWRSLPWYEPFQRVQQTTQTIVFQPSPQAFVLVFPRSTQPATTDARGASDAAAQK